MTAVGIDPMKARVRTLRFVLVNNSTMRDKQYEQSGGDFTSKPIARLVEFDFSNALKISHSFSFVCSMPPQPNTTISMILLSFLRRRGRFAKCEFPKRV